MTHRQADLRKGISERNHSVGKAEGHGDVHCSVRFGSADTCSARRNKFKEISRGKIVMGFVCHAKKNLNCL